VHYEILSPITLFTYLYHMIIIYKNNNITQTQTKTMIS